MVCADTLEIDWKSVRLGVDAAPLMFVAHWTTETGCWTAGELLPYGPLHLMPAAQVLNYGQSIFEGMKAYRADVKPPEQPRILLFRPQENAARFESGAVRMSMPPVPQEMFLDAVHAVVRANHRYVPPASLGSLYLRPLLLGTGALLGIGPASSYTFLVYAVPVGSRAKAGRLSALDFLVHESRHRAAPRGVGSTKAAGNYSPCLLAQAEARAAGCHECVYLDAKTDSYLEEGTGCNVFVVHGRTLTTPPTAGSILPGITRASLLVLARALGYEAREQPVTVQEAMQADEVFASGTAVVVLPIGSFTYQGEKTLFGYRPAPGGEGQDQAQAPAHEQRQQQQPADPSATPPPPSSVPGAQAQAVVVRLSASGDAAVAAEGGDKAACNGVVAASATACDTVVIHCNDSSSSSCGSRPSSPDGICTINGAPASAIAALCSHAVLPAAASLAPGVGPITQQLYNLLTDMQYGRAPDPFGWTVAVDLDAPQQPVAALAGVTAAMGALGVAAAKEVAVAAAAGKLACTAASAAVTAVPRTMFQDPNLE